MTTQMDEIRVRLFDIDGKKYTNSNLFAMAFLLDYDVVVYTIDEMKDIDGFDDMFIDDSGTSTLDGEYYRGYLISPDGVMLLAEEFGRIVKQK